MHNGSKSVNPATEKYTIGPHLDTRRKVDPRRKAEQLIDELVKKIAGYIDKQELKDPILSNFEINDLIWFANNSVVDVVDLLRCIAPQVNYNGNVDERRIKNRIQNLCKNTYIQKQFFEDGLFNNDILAIYAQIKLIVPVKAWKGGYGKRSKIVTRRVGQVKTGVSRNGLHKKRATRRKKRQDGGIVYISNALIQSTVDFFTNGFGEDQLILVIVSAISTFVFGLSSHHDHKQKQAKHERCQKQRQTFHEEVVSKIQQITDDKDALVIDMLRNDVVEQDEQEYTEYTLDAPSGNTSGNKTYKLPKHIILNVTEQQISHDNKLEILNKANKEHKLRKFKFKDTFHWVKPNTKISVDAAIKEKDALINKERAKISEAKMNIMFIECVEGRG